MDYKKAGRAQCGIDLAEHLKCGEPHSRNRSDSSDFSPKAMSIKALSAFCAGCYHQSRTPAICRNRAWS